MKISKVNHTKTAVIVRDKRPEGIIYFDPSQKGKEMSVEKRIEKRTEASKRLYSVFGPAKDSKGNEKKNAVAGAFNRVIRNNRQNEFANLTAERLVSEFLDVYSGENRNGGKYAENEIKEAVNVLLKSSLRKEKTISAFKLFFEKTVLRRSNFTGEELNRIDKDIKEAIKNDYNKNVVIAYTGKAVKNQNLVIQPDEVAGNAVFLPSKPGENSPRKKKEKEALSRFLMEYAVLDKEARTEMLKKLRRLLVLYFYGKDQVSLIKDNVWDDHKDKTAESGLFIDFKYSDKSKLKGNEKKVAIKEEAVKLKSIVREKNIERYRASIKAAMEDDSLYFEDKEISEFFIKRMEYEVERIYLSNNKMREYIFTKGYVAEKAWENLINYLSIKYIAIGKAVYSYALGELTKTEGDICLGNIDERYLSGISSFEYEMIKAEETLQRETAVYVSFVVGNLSRAVIKPDALSKESDILSFNLSDEKKSDYIIDESEIKKSILQFFGGSSAWKDFSFDKYYKNGEYDDKKFLADIKNLIYALRNESFHFTTKNKKDSIENEELFGAMFEYECSRAAKLDKDKFYSNNLHLYYSDASLKKVMDKIYDKYSSRASQVPAFGTVIKRGDFSSYLKSRKINVPFAGEEKNKFESAVYFLLKEIYYNAFLQSDNAKDFFIKAVDSFRIDKTSDRQGRPVTVEEHRPMEDFKRRIDEIKDGSLSEICQFIMTEYNQQNNQVRKKNANTEKIFMHYKLILADRLKEAFGLYIDENEEVFGFLCKPIVPSEESVKRAINDFLPGYTTGRYRELVDKVKDSFELKKWYITGRFLNPRQANLFVGAIRGYVQYCESIRRRADENGNSIKKKKDVKPISDIIKVLDLCTKINGNTSNEYTDYFKDGDEYAAFLENYLDFEGTGEKNKGALLAAFCNDETGGQKIGKYYDEENPILNRNIVLAKLYGATNVLANAIPKVDRKVLERYFKADKDIEDYKNSDGKCKNADQQRRVREYQELSNRVEFRDIVEYSEIINELQGQLINWAYLRERDLMYFQLGFHYLCLKNDSLKPKEYVSFMVNDNKKIDGAILYQIAAMYINGIPVYYRGKEVEEGSGKYIDNSKWNKNNGSVGVRIGKFAVYSGLLYANENGEFVPSEDIYKAGLELFEVVDEHDNITDLRNYIDHFKYYLKDNKRSMLDLYSEVFDRFFSYDMKYRKNVPNMISNILMSHLLIPSFEFGTAEKEVGKKDVKKKGRANIRLRSEDGIKPDSFTYKMENEDGKINGPAKGEEFVGNVIRVLYYPEKVDFTLNEKYYRFGSAGSYAKSGVGSMKKDFSGNRRDKDHKEFEAYKKNRVEEKGPGLFDLADSFNKNRNRDSKPVNKKKKGWNV